MTESAPRISVRGEAVLEVEPELAYIQVTVSARDKDRERALRRLSERGDELRSFLADHEDAVERVETGRLRVQPEIRERKERRAGEKIAGYSGTVRTRVAVTDFTALGEIITRLADREMTVVEGPQWSLRRDSESHRLARHQAARAALTRAAEYAHAVGSRLTGLLELADTGLAGEAATPPRAAERMSAPATAATAGQEQPVQLDLEPQLQVVRAEVEARFVIEPPRDLNSLTS